MDDWIVRIILCPILSIDMNNNFLKINSNVYDIQSTRVLFQPRCYFSDNFSIIWLTYLQVFWHPLQLCIYLFCFLIYPFSFIVDSSSHIHSTRIQANNLRNLSVIQILLITFYKIMVCTQCKCWKGYLPCWCSRTWWCNWCFEWL